MNRLTVRRVLRRLVFAGMLLTIVASPASADIFDKLKKQAKKSAQQTTEEMKKTVQEETGIGGTGNAASLRADSERMWKQCYEQMMQGAEYSKCASVCNMAKQSMADFEGAEKANQATWQRCKTSYDAALASGGSALVQSEKEKKLGMPAGTLGGNDSAGAAPVSVPTASTAATAPTPSSKPSKKPAGTPVAVKPAKLDAAAKAEVDRYAASCPKEMMLAGTYDCGCLAEEYGNVLMRLRADRIKGWETQGEPYYRNNVERAKKAAAEQGNPSIAENAQKLYDEGHAAAYAVPGRLDVENQLLGDKGSGRRCFSNKSMAQTHKEQCLAKPNGKTPFGTPIDEVYCSCMGREMAANITEKGMAHGPAHSDANMKCDPAISGKLKAKK